MANNNMLDFDKIAVRMGAKRCGKIRVSGGYFGALQLVAEIIQNQELQDHMLPENIQSE